ncbi:MAG: hypothetical protein AABM31_06215 [Actinomycetota bacterium]
MGYVKHARGGLIALAATVVALLVPGAAGAQQLAPAGGLPEPASPDLIDRAQEAGRIDNETANLYRVYALKGDSRLPAAYESNTPFDGTLELRQARRELRSMEPGPERTAVVAALRSPPSPLTTNCDFLSNTPLPDEDDTSAHFYIQYNEVLLEDSLTIDDYRASLEQAWLTEVDSFDWADPPTTDAADNEIGGKYHVRIDALGPVLYGFVSSLGTYAGPVGNNPNTAWDDEDADASCMGLNQDYSTFPSPPQASLDSTTAHEFNHSLQFGYGGLNGDNVPDDNFIEGGATWMEDEAQDGADDNYNYLYPQFDDSMGEHDTGDIYAYWLTWRGLTEPFGTDAAGAGEQIMQDFWELTSKNQASNLEAMNAALVNKGTTLPDAYHDYAIAAKFMAPCDPPGPTGYQLPHCFEEADGYTDAAGETEPHGEVTGVNQFFKGQVEDNYTLNWVVLPANAGSYDVSLSNDSSGGTLRGTVACDTGTTIRQSPLPSTVGAGGAQTTPAFDSDGCQQVAAVLTNETQTAPNPDSSEARDYTVSTATPAETARPDTTITSGPSGTSRSSTATFAFASSEAGSSFECRYDGDAFAPCSSPNTRTGLADGQHQFEVRATDSAGNTDLSPASRTFTVDPRVIPAVLDTTAPVLQSVRLSNRRFRAARAGRAISSAPLGTRVRYRLSEAATVTVRYERRVSGRRVGGRCRAVTRRNRGRKRCFRFVLVRGSARRGGTAGANSFRLTGRMNGRALRAGAYRLRRSARDGAGNTSKPRRSGSFRIVRR